MAEIIDSRRIEFWISEVVETLTKLSTFHNSKFWTWLVEDWEQDSLNLLTSESIFFVDFEIDIFNPLQNGLSQAEEDIEWAGASRESFNTILEDLIYLSAVNLHDKDRFSIHTSLADTVKEWKQYDKDFFKLGRGFNHEYITIPLDKVTVSPGEDVYSGSSVASTLHLICKVPSLPETLDISETVKRVLDPERHRDEWQRSLITNRVKHIDSFLSKTSNFFVNPIIIHLKKNSENAKIITRNGKSHLKIDLANFLDENQNLEGDQRSLDIIDGQHRVRGSARSSKGGVTYLPFVLIPGGYDSDLAAKLFTEINTTSKELDKDHQLYLAYRYRLSHHKVDLTMGSYDLSNRNYHDRANRMAYELAARLSSKEQSLETQIKFLQSNFGSNSIDIVQWQNYVKKWFMTNQPYGPESEIINVEDIFLEVNNYFNAWRNTLNDAWVYAAKSGWRSRTIFQYKTCFRVLLTRFSQIYDKAKTLSPEQSEITTEVFEQVLSPLKNLPSNEKQIIDTYNRTSEFFWKCLDAWVHDAIQNGISYEKHEIMSAEIKGMPGKGILAGVIDSNQWIIEDDENGNWPSNRTRYITVKRPSNCYMSLKIAVLSGSSELRDVSRTTITWDSNNHCRVPIRYSTIPEDLDQISVRLMWRNAIDGQEKTLVISRN